MDQRTAALSGRLNWKQASASIDASFASIFHVVESVRPGLQSFTESLTGGGGFTCGNKHQPPLRRIGSL